jgi:hypothetical protein
MQPPLHPKVLTLCISGLLVCLVVYWAQAQTTKKPAPTPTPEKTVTIEDTIARRIGKNQIVLKAEFDAVKQSDQSAAVARKKSVGTTTKPGIEGSFDCSCRGTGTGSCGLVTTGNNLICQSTSGNCGCELTVITK